MYPIVYELSWCLFCIFKLLLTLLIANWNEKIYLKYSKEGLWCLTSHLKCFSTEYINIWNYGLMKTKKSKLSIAHLKNKSDTLFLKSSVITQCVNIENHILSWCKVVYFHLSSCYWWGSQYLTVTKILKIISTLQAQMPMQI